jgi:segregation and condensation protein A
MKNSKPMDAAPLPPLPDDFEQEEGGTRLMVAFDGFEGPLDVLLDLARREKLDLHALPILQLAEQYLAFISAAQSLRLELAGDYLVMAAWLTYLKSRLLLPAREEENAPPAEELAEKLAEKLRKLEAIRKAGQALGALYDSAGVSFPRGRGEDMVVAQRTAWLVSLHELITAYAARRMAKVETQYRIHIRKTLSIPDARAILERILGHSLDWCPLEVFIPAMVATGAGLRSSYASSLVAALELAREGQLSVRQEGAFTPLYLKYNPSLPAPAFRA